MDWAIFIIICFLSIVTVVTLLNTMLIIHMMWHNRSSKSIEMNKPKISKEDTTEFIKKYENLINSIISENRNSTPQEVSEKIFSNIEADVLNGSNDIIDAQILESDDIYEIITNMVKRKMKNQKPISNEDKVTTILQMSETSSDIRDGKGGNHLVDIFKDSNINKL